MNIIDEVQLDFSDVTLQPKSSSLSSRSLTSVERTFSEFKHSPLSWKGVPIIAANMDTVGTMAMARTLASQKLCTALHKHHEINDEFCKLFTDNPLSVFYTMGSSETDAAKYADFVKKYGSNAYMICLDVANGYTQKFSDFVKKIRDENPTSIIMAGNVVTGAMTEQLIMSGADIVKVGIGSGSACLTRRVAGVGRPQLSAVIDCADAAHGLGGRICSDGGCVVPGDVAKAMAAGADFVMLGGMLAGHRECGGTVFADKDGNETMEFYGMSSDVAMEKYSGGTQSYRSSEGRVLKVPYRGNVADTVEHILGGLRSNMTYIGALELREMPKRATFYKVNRQLNQSLAE